MTLISWPHERVIVEMNTVPRRMNLIAGICKLFFFTKDLKVSESISMLKSYFKILPHKIAWNSFKK